MKMPLHSIARHVALTVGVLLLLTSAGAADLTGGGGSKRTDCLTVFDAPVNIPAANPKHIRCEDGTSCDEDGVINGVCEVSVAICANSTPFPSCLYSGVETIIVEHALDNGDPKFDPEFQALQAQVDSDIALPTAAPDQCTAASKIRVRVKGPLARNRCRRNTKRIRLITESEVINGRIYRDRDSLKVVCLPSTAPNGCDPQQFFTSTFDRIQQQILNQSCALSSCHDSESYLGAGGLLLESSTSHAALVNTDPTNGAALGANWKRVDPGNPATSFMLHKVNGDFPGDGFGARMPFGRPKLPRVLRDLIEIWIQNGAPDDTGGWIPGTY